MKICYLDAFSGIAGDMTVGALLDAGADQAALLDGLTSLATGAAFLVEKTQRRGITASKFHVDVVDTKKHRHLPHILDMIGASKLPDSVKQNAARVFQRLGEAEAKVHGVAIEKVHFHEVGAVDSICDIAGACLGFHLLCIDEIYASAINVGSGTAKTEHGILPVPTPATAELLKGQPIYARGPAMELTTPTGAAIVATLAREFGALPAMSLLATGYGAGDRDFPENANVLRVLIGERSGTTEATTVAVLEANIDDSSPQVLGYAMEKLLESGALDVTLQPVYMKKNRPGMLLQAIARPEDRESIASIIFAETSTLGLRTYDAQRRVKARTIIEVDIAAGRVRIKAADDGSFAPEYEDCKRLAHQSGIPLKQILQDSSVAYLKSIR
jgi:uncharacterized protein (TIGR00299 family) protein